jgi:hypothetical protein
MHPFDSFNASEAHAINAHLQAVSLNFIQIALGRLIAIDELATAIDTNLMPVYLSFSHFYGCESSYIQGIASDLTLIHLSIMQRREMRSRHPFR